MKTNRNWLVYEITSMILACIIIIGCLLPFAAITTTKIGIVSENGFNSRAWVVYSILAVIFLVLIPVSGSNLRMKKGVLLGFGVMFLLTTAQIIFLYIGSDIYDYKDEWGRVLNVELGIGLYLELIISMGLLIIGAILPTKEKELAQIDQ